MVLILLLRDSFRVVRWISYWIFGVCIRLTDLKVKILPVCSHWDPFINIGSNSRIDAFGQVIQRFSAFVVKLPNLMSFEKGRESSGH